MKSKTDSSFILRFRQALRKDATLPPHLKNTLQGIASFANADGRCYLKLQTVAIAAGLKTRQARRNVRALEARGWLETELRRGRGHVGTFQLGLGKPVIKPVPKPVITDPENRSSETTKTGTTVPPEDGETFGLSYEDGGDRAIAVESAPAQLSHSVTSDEGRSSAPESINSSPATAQERSALLRVPSPGGKPDALETFLGATRANGEPLPPKRPTEDERAYIARMIDEGFIRDGPEADALFEQLVSVKT